MQTNLKEMTEVTEVKMYIIGISGINWLYFVSIEAAYDKFIYTWLSQLKFFKLNVENAYPITSFKTFLGSFWLT